MAYARFVGNPFKGADDLWKSFQNNLRDFTNNGGSNATATEPIKYRPDWDKVDKVLKGERPISDLGCN